jgi:MFS family permease
MLTHPTHDTLSTVGMAAGGLLWGRLSDRLNVRSLLFIGSAAW